MSEVRRRLLVIGATSTLIRARLGSGKSCLYPWAAALLQRKPYRVATVALANKIARIVWALLRRGKVYRPAVEVRI